MPLRSITFLCYFLGSCGLSFITPMVGVVCYLVVYHVFPHTTWWGKHLSFLGLRYSFLCGVCLLVGTALNLNRLRFGRRFLHPIELMCLSVLLVMVLSSIASGTWCARTEFALDKMFKVILFGLMMVHVVTSRRYMWTLTILFTALSLYLGMEARNAPPGAFTDNRLDGVGGPDFRESASLAIHLFALLPFVGVVLRQKSILLKALAFLAGCYSINAILMCRARTAFVAGVIAGVLAIWYIPKRHRLWVVVMLILAVIGGVILSDTWFWERMFTIFDAPEERDASAAYRLVIWSAAWEMFKANPGGVGVGQFRNRIGQYAVHPSEYALVHDRDAHNSYILCAAETGVLGLAVYLGTLAMAWLTLGRAERMARRHIADSDRIELMVFACRLALLVYMISGMFVSRFYTEATWIFIMMPACLDRVVENEIRATSKQTAALLMLNMQLEETARGHLLPAT
jgi:putative inorganic carbon (hco3(-)) transporter